MPLTCENIVPLSFFKRVPAAHSAHVTAVPFLSFQDAMHYLIAAFDLAGKTILLPSFYCDVTLDDFRKHGLTVRLYATDHARFDADISDFYDKIASDPPDIVVVYNYFGKTSGLYDDPRWVEALKPGAFIVSDYAHTLYDFAEPKFLHPRHVVIDSARKTTGCMMAHLIAPAGFVPDGRKIANVSAFRLLVRLLFLGKNFCLRWGQGLGLVALVRLGLRIYGLHDDLIGSRQPAFAAFGFDDRIYRHIDFARIKAHKATLYAAYRSAFAQAAAAGCVFLLPVPRGEDQNLCFFPVRVMAESSVPELLQHLENHGYWVEQLWNFDAIKTLSAAERAWSKSVLALPFTPATTIQDIHAMAALVESFYAEPATDIVAAEIS
ncbi:MAG TPA: hypothetical protein VL402_07955 [Xanthobacteraceae bacterium]|jgi:hypothetical protein|nr:hypothetical protein [Xanthobacteraceae bacterium]